MNDLMSSFDDDEKQALESAAAAMAQYWRDCGLQQHVRAIGRERGLMGAMLLLTTYYSVRHRQTAERGRLEDDAIPF